MCRHCFAARSLPGRQGWISPAELYIFFKEIHHMWVHVMHEYADLSIYDVVDEILDMVKPKASRNPHSSLGERRAALVSKGCAPAAGLWRCSWRAD